MGNLMRILKMYLKLSFSHFKWILQTRLSLTVLSNCVCGSSNFDTAFLPDCTKFLSVFLSYWTVNLMRILKMYLKHSFFYSKWILQAILSVTVISNCNFSSSNFDTVFLPNCTKFLSVFLSCWTVNLMRILKMYLKQSFFFLQVGFTGNFVRYCHFKP